MAGLGIGLVTDRTRGKHRMTGIKKVSRASADESISLEPLKKSRVLRTKVPKPALTGRYAALDFETADYGVAFGIEQYIKMSFLTDFLSND